MLYYFMSCLHTFICFHMCLSPSFDSPFRISVGEKLRALAIPPKFERFCDAQCQLITFSTYMT